jgi:hypothetical protein
MELTYTLTIETTGWPHDPNLDLEAVENTLRTFLQDAVDRLYEQDGFNPDDTEILYSLKLQRTKAGERYES